MTTQASILLSGKNIPDHWLLKLGGIAAVINVAIIPIQIIIYMISPPPTSINNWFILLHQNPVIGLLNLDLLYLVNNILLIPMYIVLWALLKPTHASVATTALIIGLVGIAVYFPTNTAFEMLALSKQYSLAASAAEQSLLLAAGQAMIAQSKGTAFVVYYLLNAIALLMFAGDMYYSRIFTRKTAYAGIIAGFLMLVPSTFGEIGLIFAFASLLPWAIFSILIARTLF